MVALLCELHFSPSLYPPLSVLCINLSCPWGMWGFGDKESDRSFQTTGTETRIDKTLEGIGCHVKGLTSHPEGWSLQTSGREMIFFFLILRTCFAMLLQSFTSQYLPGIPWENQI